MIFWLKFLYQSLLLNYDRKHFFQKAFLIFFLFVFNITAIKLLVNALFEFYYRASEANFGVIFNFDIKMKVVLLFYILNLVFIINIPFFFPWSHRKLRLEWLDVERRLYKFLLFYPLNNSREVIKHIIIVYIFFL